MNGDFRSARRARLIEVMERAGAVVLGQAFSWHLSITGAKAEDIFVLTERGPEVVARASVAIA